MLVVLNKYRRKIALNLQPSIVQKKLQKHAGHALKIQVRLESIFILFLFKRSFLHLVIYDQSHL